MNTCTTYVKYFLTNTNVQGVNVRNVAIFSFIAKKIQIMINMRLTLTAHHHYQVKTIQFVKGYTLFKLAKVVIETVLKMREGYLFIQNPFTSHRWAFQYAIWVPMAAIVLFIFFTWTEFDHEGFLDSLPALPILTLGPIKNQILVLIL